MAGNVAGVARTWRAGQAMRPLETVELPARVVIRERAEGRARRHATQLLTITTGKVTGGSTGSRDPRGPAAVTVQVVPAASAWLTMPGAENTPNSPLNANRITVFVPTTSVASLCAWPRLVASTS